MTCARIAVDGQLLLSGDLGQWLQRSPETLDNMISGAPAQPYMKAVLVVLTDAALMNRDVEITVSTGGPDEWTLVVRNL